MPQLVEDPREGFVAWVQTPFEEGVGEQRSVCGAVSFTAMKKNASAFAPASGKTLFKSDDEFFRSGQNEQWREVLGPRELAIYESRATELLGRDILRWLEHGSI